jgi:glycosyltransferase involved in cell wall biosynthesis
MPAAILHYRSPELKLYIDGLLAQTAFDRVVADFLVMASNCPRLEKSVLFEHNVETMIWRRHAEHASLPADRRLFRQQARRMFTFEREACRSAGSVIAVSEQDATLIRTMFGAEEVCPVPTGVDAGYYAPPASTQPVADLVFTGAMDWHANVDGVLYFLDRILPKIRCRRPQTTFVVVGKSPHPEILDRARHDPQLRVTGTVADVRPYLWGASVSVVPLRIGSGTRLKIYEAMAAGVPVVSTALGAEGLELTPGQDICIADDPAEFAARCVELLEDRERRSRMSAAARQLVTERFSWERVARSMEQALESAPSACS